MSRPDAMVSGAGNEGLLLTPAEVATILRATRRAVYAPAERGQLPRRLQRLVRHLELVPLVVGTPSNTNSATSGARTTPAESIAKTPTTAHPASARGPGMPYE